MLLHNRKLVKFLFLLYNYTINFLAEKIMKVYFSASLLGKEEYSKEYKTIIKFIHDLGHTSYADHVMNRDAKEVAKHTKDQHERDYRRTREQIEKSDVMIVEATYPSIGVGHTISMALQMYKSILVLYRSPENPHGLLLGDPERLLTIKKYDPKEPQKLKEILKTFLEHAQKKLLRIRLNLMIDEEQDEYLNLISQTRGISKSNFIRQLIDKSKKGEIKLD